MSGGCQAPLSQAAKLAAQVTPDVALRRVSPVFPPAMSASPLVLGVDGFALREG